MISDYFLEANRRISSCLPVDRDSMERALRVLDRSLFDGHTDFPGFSHEVRLQWISEASHFVTRYCGMAAAGRMNRKHDHGETAMRFDGTEEWLEAFSMDRNPWLSSVLGF